VLYPNNLEDKLGFNRIRIELTENCVSNLGVRFVKRIKFSNSKRNIDKWLNQTSEFVRILESGVLFPNSNYIDFSSYLKKAQVENSFLSEEEFFDLVLSLKTLDECLHFFKGKREEFPALVALTEPIEFDDDIYRQIAAKFDERGKLRDNASPRLAEIRIAIQSEQRRLRKVLDGVLKSARKNEFTPDDISITVRDGRMVIPILAEYKRRVKGFIHGESSTGQTVYIEPTEVLEINNEVRELQYAEKREVIRILTSLTDSIRPHLVDFEGYVHFLGLIDFIRAKARFALSIGASKPLWSEVKGFVWKNAKHPILFLSHSDLKKPVIPLNIKLSESDRILVISGPNAGGKSVCLKTVGLVQYMFQCGMLVPADEDSEFNVFNDLFIDIGDEQSIENDLSTYSSHLVNMKQFLNHITKKSLFLIDEFGTGTEPQFGGAIAEAILNQLNHLSSMGVITTHYGNLKEFADKKVGLVNGAMKYDVVKLQPLYQLEIGKPGSSFALEIAEKIGLPKQTIEEAKSKVGVKQVSLDKLLGQLDSQKVVADKTQKRIAAREKELDETAKQYQELKTHLERKEKVILRDAKQEAQMLIKAANGKIENIIRGIKESEADKQKVKLLRSELEEFKTKKLKTEKISPVEASTKVSKGDIRIGDNVRIKEQGTIGKVIGMKGKDVEISIGALSSKVKLARLEKVSRSERKESDRVILPKGVSLNDKMANFSHRLDIRGLRVEEVIPRLEQYIDEAILIGANELNILHGKGSGVLRELVRNQLKEFKEVDSMADEHADRGGAGVTIVKMK